MIVENLGKEAAKNFSVSLLRVVSINDSGLVLGENIKTLQLTELPAGETADIEFTTDLLIEGINKFYVTIDFEKDEFVSDNISEFVTINVVQINERRGDIVINEIMYAPLSPEPEWIEIYNKSEKLIELKGYQIADDANKYKVVSNSIILKPGEYLVFARDSIFNSLYENATNVVVANFQSLKNSGDIILLTDSLGRTIDSLRYKYTWGGNNGKSLERIDAFSSSTDSSNWQTALLEKGGSPGKINTVSKKDYDCAVINIVFSPERPCVNEEVTIKTKVENLGYKNASVKLILNEVDAKGTKKEIEKSSIINIASSASILYEFNYKISSITCRSTFEVDLIFPEDEDTTNNDFSFPIQPSYLPNTVLINEIMFNPVNGEPEWIELFNSSDYNIDLDGWSISDILTTPIKTELIEIVLPGNSFLIITKDSSIYNYHVSIPSKIFISGFANLNNDEDGIVLKDSWDAAIDSVRYNRTWGGENGKSIERKSVDISSNDKSNWVSSTDIELSTPGRINSIVRKKYDLALTRIKCIPEFPALGDEIAVCAEVKNIGFANAQNFFMEFGFINNADTVLFNTVNVDGLNVSDSITIYSTSEFQFIGNTTVFCRVVFESDLETSNNSLSKIIESGYKAGDILISEIMYNPYDGESEWIEIVSNSDKQINLRNWTVCDLENPTKGTITQNDIFLRPGEFAVLTSDTSKYPFYPPDKFFHVKFGSLGNASDGFVIYDNRGLVIDSVEYNSKWGGEKGFSLERLSFSWESCDSTNWSTSLNINGATPGLKNSITEIFQYSKSSLVINEIMFDPVAGNSEFVEFYNTTDDTLQLGGMKLQIGEDKIIKLSSTFCEAYPKSFIVFSVDSSITNNYSSLSEEASKLLINNSIRLSNDGTTLTLRDIAGNCLDSVNYYSSWHNKNILSTKNRSLERLNPLLNSNDRMNWSSSVNPAGATPGKQNSVYVKSVASEAKVSINPNPFSPDNDGFEDFAAINFNLTKQLAQVRIKVFDSIGRLVRTLADNIPTISNNTIIFDGLDDRGRALRIGIYILLIEAVANDGSTETIKTPIVVARKL